MDLILLGLGDDAHTASLFMVQPPHGDVVWWLDAAAAKALVRP